MCHCEGSGKVGSEDGERGGGGILVCVHDTHIQVTRDNKVPTFNASETNCTEENAMTDSVI